MIYQMHLEDKIDHALEFVAQSGNITIHKEMTEWQKDVAERHPLPEGYQWLLCNEKSLKFMTSESNLHQVAKKVLSCFPETIPDGQENVEFDIPAYIIEELREALKK